MGVRETINKHIVQAEEKGFQYKTKYSYIQNSFSRIIVPSEMKNGGTVRTMKQANDFLTKKFGEKAILFTEETYKKELQELKEMLGKEYNIKGFFSERKREINNIIDDMNDNLGTSYNLDDYTLEEQNELIKRANEILKENYGDISEYFYTALEEAINGG